MSLSMTMLLLFFLGGENDIVSALDPQDYFKTRGIQVTTQKLVELATTKPTTGEAQFQQLLALRVLADNAKEIRKSENYEDVYEKIEAVAKGRKAQDIQGFARSYAQETYRTLGGKIEIVRRKRPPTSVRKDAFEWFPKSVTLVGSVDTRGIPGEKDAASKIVTKRFLPNMPQRAKEMFYQQIEKLGNVRIDRVSFAWEDEQPGQHRGKIFVRFTGKANHDWFVEMLKRANNFDSVKTKTRFRGRKITVLLDRGDPGIAVIGDTDLVIAGYAGGADGIDLIQNVLKIRASKSPDVLAGPLGKKLAKVSPKASAVLVGIPPKEFQSELSEGRAPFRIRSFPKTFLMQLIVDKKVYAVKASGEFGTAQAAKTFVTDANNLLKIAIANMQQAKNNPPRLPLAFPNWGKLIDGGVKALKTIELKAKGQGVDGTGRLPKPLVEKFVDFGAITMGRLFGSVRRATKKDPGQAKKTHR